MTSKNACPTEKDKTMKMINKANTCFQANIMLLLILLLSAMFNMLFAAEYDAAQWLKWIDDAERVTHSYGVMNQTITTSGGSERTLTMRTWSDDNGDVSLMVYTAPARVKGDKILMRDGGDNIWYYMQRRDVTRHFTGLVRRQSAMGSDFSYEDLSQGTMTEDYTAELLGYEDYEDLRCVKLKLVPTESGPSYAYLIIWADDKDCLSRKIEYYDEEGLLKTLYITDFKKVEDRMVAFKMEMKNHREGSRTLMETESVTFANKPEAWMFTKEALTREIKP